MSNIVEIIGDTEIVVIQESGIQGPAGSSEFIDLTDVPSSYSGQALKTLRVNAGETALEFTTSGAGVSDHGALTGLSDDDHSQYHNDTRGDVRYYTKTQSDLAYEPINANIQSHISSTSNPHSVTATQVGLGNVDNTSDLNKPVSTATQTALDGKVDENAAITGATKTKITYDAKGLVASGSDATTADIADSSNKRYVTDAQLTVIGNTSGTNTGDQDLSGYELLSNKDTDGTLAANSDTKYPSQKATKTYADTKQTGSTKLTDIAALSYASNALKVIRVNAGETAYELAAPSGGGTWGSITGTLSSQTDLQSALDAKLAKAGGTMTGSLILAAGTASASTAPAKLQSGTSMTTPENGAIEYDGSNVFITIGGTRFTFTRNSATQTLSNKRLNPRMQSISSSATVTPNADDDDIVVVTAQAAGLTLANWSGTPVAGQAMIIRVKDNGTARTIAFGSQYRAFGVSLPTTTTISKTLYISCIWNAVDTKIDVLGVVQEI